MVIAFVLSLSNFSKRFMIEIDAYKDGIGFVLMQEGYPITYTSKALFPKNQLLSIYEKEILAILNAIKKYKPYLVNQHFVIKIDHQSLKNLLKQNFITPL